MYPGLGKSCFLIGCSNHPTDQASPPSDTPTSNGSNSSLSLSSFFNQPRKSTDRRRNQTSPNSFSLPSPPIHGQVQVLGGRTKKTDGAGHHLPINSHPFLRILQPSRRRDNGVVPGGGNWSSSRMDPSDAATTASSPVAATPLKADLAPGAPVPSMRVVLGSL